jgi:hypothetical protein
MHVWSLGFGALYVYRAFLLYLYPASWSKYSELNFFFLSWLFVSPCSASNEPANLTDTLHHDPYVDTHTDCYQSKIQNERVQCMST